MPHFDFGLVRGSTLTLKRNKETPKDLLTICAPRRTGRLSYCPNVTRRLWSGQQPKPKNYVMQGAHPITSPDVLKIRLISLQECWMHCPNTSTKQEILAISAIALRS